MPKEHRITRRNFLKIQAVAAGTMLTQCNKQTFPPDLPFTPKPNTSIIDQIHTQICHVISKINQYADRQIAEILTPALTELLEINISEDIIQGSNEYWLLFDSNTIFSKDLHSLETASFISKVSQLLRHRELITTNKFNIPQEFHHTYLYIAAIETINQYYQGKMELALTNTLEPQVVTKYIYSLNGVHPYNTIDIPKPEPRSLWTHLSANGSIPKIYFYQKQEPNQLEIPNTPFHTTNYFIQSCNRRPQRFVDAIIYPSLTQG